MTTVSKRRKLRVVTGAQTLLKGLLTKIDWPVVFFCYFATGLLLFHAKANWSVNPLWDYFYYAWDGGLWIIGILAIFKYRSDLIRTCFPFLFYSIARLCIYIITIITKTDINGRVIVGILFILALSSTIFLTISQILKEWKQSNSG